MENSLNVEGKHIVNQQVIAEVCNKYFAAIVENINKGDVLFYK